MEWRRQLIGMRTMERKRLATAAGWSPPRPGAAPALAEAHIERVDREFDERIRARSAWREKDDLLRGIPGVGPVLSRSSSPGGRR